MQLNNKQIEAIDQALLGIDGDIIADIRNEPDMNKRAMLLMQLDQLSALRSRIAEFLG